VSKIKLSNKTFQTFNQIGLNLLQEVFKVSNLKVSPDYKYLCGKHDGIRELLDAILEKIVPVDEDKDSNLSDCCRENSGFITRNGLSICWRTTTNHLFVTYTVTDVSCDVCETVTLVDKEMFNFALSMFITQNVKVASLSTFDQNNLKAIMPKNKDLYW
jgi:hypothetical protein